MTHRLSILLAFLACGCKNDTPAAAAPPDAAPRVVVRAPPDARPAPPDARRAAADAAAQAVDLAPSKGPVGIAPCDEYLAKMAKCIKHLGPEAAEPMKNAMTESTKAWQQNARTAEGRAALVDTCRQALDAARSAAAAMGCEW
jgi:hypothetical protein